MPIVVNLDVELAKRKMTLTQVAKMLDITLANASIFKTGKLKAIRVSSLDIICRELGCQPGDLLEYVDDKTYKKLYGRKWHIED